MTSLFDRNTHDAEEFLGAWEEIWRERASIAWSTQRYHLWLRQQGYSRDEAAERAVRFLAAHPPTFRGRPPALGGTIVH